LKNRSQFANGIHMTSELGHMVTQHILAPAENAFAYLSDPLKLGLWSLGCFGTSLDETCGIHTGTSLFDGTRGWFRIEPEPTRMLLDYWVGTPDRFRFRISARVIPGDTVGYDERTCLVMLSAWRPEGMPPERWERLCASHEAEIWLIKAQIEKEHERAAEQG
jgi:hypothetical protein